ncbi:hypothetical protein BD413DRAFT_161489 [Trametes elegans]|nr:hypothetical protein BD413DRAFT_161489 [Trametes elegans]
MYFQSHYLQSCQPWWTIDTRLCGAAGRHLPRRGSRQTRHGSIARPPRSSHSMTPEARAPEILWTHLPAPGFEVNLEVTLARGLAFQGAMNLATLLRVISSSYRRGDSASQQIVAVDIGPVLASTVTSPVALSQGYEGHQCMRDKYRTYYSYSHAVLHLERPSCSWCPFVGN